MRLIELEDRGDMLRVKDAFMAVISRGLAEG